MTDALIDLPVDDQDLALHGRNLHRPPRARRIDRREMIKIVPPRSHFFSTAAVLMWYRNTLANTGGEVGRGVGT